MDRDNALRSHLISLIEGGNAHMTITEAVKDFPEEGINAVFPNGTYSPWHLLEHMRLAQWDILDFIKNPDYKEREWPKDYWPSPTAKATRKDWDGTIRKLDSDSAELKKIVKDPKTDLYAKLPNGTGQTILREILVVSDHNAYHLGEFAILRQVMGTWGKGHR